MTDLLSTPPSPPGRIAAAPRPTATCRTARKAVPADHPEQRRAPRPLRHVGAVHRPAGHHRPARRTAAAARHRAGNAAPAAAPRRGDHRGDGVHRRAGRRSGDLVRDEVARGAVIPANHNHPESEPMIIGKAFVVKVNANIGNSAVSSIAEEVIRWCGPSVGGADTIMDLSTGSGHPRHPRMDSAQLPVPVAPCRDLPGAGEGHKHPTRPSWEVYRDTDRAMRAGVDYMTVHAGVLPHPADRRAGHRHRQPRRRHQRSPGAAHHRESFCYTNFDELCEILAMTDRSLLGDGLRRDRSPTPTTRRSSRRAADAGRTGPAAKSAGVQGDTRGPGHVRCTRSAENVRPEEERAAGAVLHPGPGWPPTSHRAGPHHLGDQGGDDRSSRDRDAGCCDTQGAPGLPELQGRQDGVTLIRSPAAAVVWPRGLSARPAAGRPVEGPFEFR